MSNTLNHTSSRQIVRHYTHRQKRCKHLMQYFVSANGLYEFKVKIYAFLFTVILEGNCRSVSIIADISCFFLFHFHAIRYAFYSIHPTYRAECENERLTLLLTAQGCALSL
ncbi:hypothetical protein BK382_13035 [Escherichia coli]|nr:hypothetical protein BK382_13035 [Escherichia coli]OJR52478.1 hypothetical protein BK381_02010 [Escherichia coli]OJS68600.1 hypothetical protein BK407_06125 [Escherichia coli]